MPSTKRITPWRITALFALVALSAVTFFIVRTSLIKQGPLHDYSVDFNAFIRAQYPNMDTQENRIGEVRALVEEIDRVRTSSQENNTFLMTDALSVADEQAWDAIYEDSVFSYETHRAHALDYFDDLEKQGLLDRLAQLPEIQLAVSDMPEGMSIFGDVFSGLDGHIIPLQGALQLATELLDLAQHESRLGNNDRAIALYEQALALARLVSQQHLLINALVAYTIEISAIEYMSNMTIERRFHNEQLEKIARIARAHRSLPITHALQGERLFVDDLLQYVFAENNRIAMTVSSGMGFTETIFDKLPRHSFFNLAGYFLPSRQATEDAMDAFIDTVIEYAQDTSVPKPGIKDEAEWAAVFELLPFVAQFVAVYPGAVNRAAQNTAHRNAFYVIVALEKYRNDTGTYPSMIDALVPEYLEALPRDPFARAGSFLYRPPAEDRAHYVLYSIGINLKDDGGTSENYADILFAEPSEN